jgi:para-aminobenzoate synthetase component 1
MIGSKRFIQTFNIPDPASFKSRLLNYLSAADTAVVLDSNGYKDSYHRYDLLAGIGVRKMIAAPAGRAFERLQQFIDEEKDWLFGHLGYDLKNETESLKSGRPDHIGFNDLSFFVPEILLMLRGHELSIGSFSYNHDLIYTSLLTSEQRNTRHELPVIKSRFSKEEYIDTIHQLKQHILRGDCYEINFCQEFYAENVLINPEEIYKQLVTVSPNPFSAFYKQGDKYLLCASPERYLRKQGNHIISQPIKGTWKRDIMDAVQDERNRESLFNSTKDRSENVMVVDLVRNDFSKISKKASVKVEELYGIYRFPQVYQMISTISCEAADGKRIADIFKASFPMGSMTGAPKKRVMELIEQYERSKRGLFSGAVGYIDPSGDFDLNVVIRSIFYNSSSKYLSYQVGSGITFYSDPQQEFEECLLKAKAIEKVLSGSISSDENT